MASIFEKWNNAIDVEGLQKDVQEASQNDSTNHDDVPYGTYEVKVEKMELKASSKGDPMFSAWFRIVEGQQKNRLIFMNQVITQGFQIHIVNEFLRSLDTNKTVEFTDYGQYNNLILDVMEEVDSEGLEYLLEYGQNNKGFGTYKVKEVFQK